MFENGNPRLIYNLRLLTLLAVLNKQRYYAAYARPFMMDPTRKLDLVTVRSGIYQLDP